MFKKIRGKHSSVKLKILKMGATSSQQKAKPPRKSRRNPKPNQWNANPTYQSPYYQQQGPYPPGPPPMAPQQQPFGPPPPPQPQPNCFPFYGQYPYPGYLAQEQPAEPTEGTTAGSQEAEAEAEDGATDAGAAADEEYVTISMRSIFWKLLIAASIVVPLLIACAFYLLWARQPGPGASINILTGPSSSITWRDVGAIWMVCCITSKLLRVVTGIRSDFDV